MSHAAVKAKPMRAVGYGEQHLLLYLATDLAFHCNSLLFFSLLIL
jgi:hypothetical protein